MAVIDKGTDVEGSGGGPFHCSRWWCSFLELQ